MWHIRGHPSDEFGAELRVISAAPVAGRFGGFGRMSALICSRLLFGTRGRHGLKLMIGAKGGEQATALTYPIPAALPMPDE